MRQELFANTGPDRSPVPSGVSFGDGILAVHYLTSLTAKPVLALWLEARGWEIGDVGPAAAWEVFKAFCEIPVRGETDEFSFQVEFVDEGEPSLSIRFVRELEDDFLGKSSPCAVSIEFIFTNPDTEFETSEVWSSDYPSLEVFFEAVEAHPAFAFACSEAPSVSLVHYED